MVEYDGLILTFLQLLVPIALIFCRFKRRKYFLWRLVGFGLLFSGLSALYYSPNAIPIPAGGGYYLYYILAYAYVFLYVWLCFDMPFLTMLFFVLQGFLIQNFSHHIFMLIMRAASVPLGQEYSKFEYLVLLTGIYAIVYSVYYFVIIRKVKLREISTVPKISVGVALVFLLVMIVLGIYVRHINEELRQNSTAIIGYELYSCILVFFIICMHFGVFNIGKLQESNEQLERRIEQESRYYEISRSNVEEINMRCHDLKHQISALRNMRGEEKQQVITELENSLRVYESLVKTGNEALDYVLMDKGINCANNNINFTVIADGKLISHVSYNDIYVLFGNALDNAIESVMKIENEKQRIISLKIQEHGGMAHVHIENTCKEQPRFSGGLPLTTKTDEGHGYGVRSIKYIVEKYGGNLTVTLNNEIFALDFLIPPKSK